MKTTLIALFTFALAFALGHKAGCTYVMGGGKAVDPEDWAW